MLPSRPTSLPRRVGIALMVAVVLAVGLAAATTASAQSPPSYAFENRGTHGVLDVAGESTAAGARVVDWAWHGGFARTASSGGSSTSGASRSTPTSG